MEVQEEKSSGCFILLAGGRGGGRGYERGEGGEEVQQQKLMLHLLLKQSVIQSRVMVLWC